MCRWFAYVSATEECLLEDVLVSKSAFYVAHQHCFVSNLLEPTQKRSQICLFSGGKMIFPKI